ILSAPLSRCAGEGLGVRVDSTLDQRLPILIPPRPRRPDDRRGDARGAGGGRLVRGAGGAAACAVPGATAGYVLPRSAAARRVGAVGCGALRRDRAVGLWGGQSESARGGGVFPALSVADAGGGRGRPRRAE